VASAHFNSARQSDLFRASPFVRDRAVYAPVAKIEGEFACVRFPEKVRNLPFPRVGGEKYGKVAIAKLVEVV
jgi:hypothetical protein